MSVRPSEERDHAAILEVLRASFETQAEADLVDAIHRGGFDPVSLVHETEGVVDGYCLLSQMRSPKNCLGLGPVAVTGAHRRSGLGALLIREAITRAVSNGWAAIFCLGDPAYYKRFGFSVEAARDFESGYPKDYFQILELEDGAAATLDKNVLYTEAFDRLPA